MLAGWYLMASIVLMGGQMDGALILPLWVEWKKKKRLCLILTGKVEGFKKKKRAAGGLD